MYNFIKHKQNSRKLLSGGELSSLFGGIGKTVLQQAPSFINNPTAPQVSTAKKATQQIGKVAADSLVPGLGNVMGIGQDIANKLGSEECDPITGECADSSSDLANISKSILDPLGTLTDLLSGKFGQRNKKKLEEIRQRAIQRRLNEYQQKNNAYQANQLIKEQNKYQTMGDNFGYFKKGGFIKAKIRFPKFQSGGNRLQITQTANTTVPWALTEQQKAGESLARELYNRHNGNLVAVKQEIDNMKERGLLPAGVRNIKVQPLGWQHYAPYHPNKTLDELESMVRQGLQDDEQRVVVGVEFDDNPFNSNYPIEIGVAKAPNRKAGVTYGKVTEDERVTMERKRPKEEVYRATIERTKNAIRNNWDRLPEFLKEHYRRNAPDFVPSNAKGGLLYKKGGVNSSGNYTKPSLRKLLFNKIKAGNKGGKSGQWSARKAQLLAREYKSKGGGYK